MRFVILVILLVLPVGCKDKSTYDRNDRSTWPAQAMDTPMDELGRMSMQAHISGQLAKLDTSNAQIDLDRLYMANYLWFDSIPALTMPPRVQVAEASYPEPWGRVVEVTIGDVAVAYPIGILNWHEIVNDEVGGIPIAVIYCPLCDSVSVLDRRLVIEYDDDVMNVLTLEFGTSGFLDNSNVVMYERHSMTLWSQVGMEALTGPHAGKTLRHLPFRMMSFEQFIAAHPGGEVLSTDTGHGRRYDENPYAGYLDSDSLFMEFEYGDALPAKTLGVGIRADEFVVFITVEMLIGTSRKIDTPRGEVELAADENGIQILFMPEGVEVIQTFYHAWSAYFPETEVITD